MLTVRKDNPRAIEFYKRFGFEIVGHFSGGEPAWAMRRTQPATTSSVP
jgi:ribosomal protein S18 acetylase RimI-like enzyme